MSSTLAMSRLFNSNQIPITLPHTPIATAAFDVTISFAVVVYLLHSGQCHDFRYIMRNLSHLLRKMSGNIKNHKSRSSHMRVIIRVSIRIDSGRGLC